MDVSCKQAIFLLHLFTISPVPLLFSKYVYSNKINQAGKLAGTLRQPVHQWLTDDLSNSAWMNCLHCTYIPFTYLSRSWYQHSQEHRHIYICPARCNRSLNSGTACLHTRQNLKLKQELHVSVTDRLFSWRLGGMQQSIK